MAKRASIARIISFIHLAKDGKTPVYNPALNKWEYQTDPTIQQVEDSADRLLQIDDKAVEAKNIAESKVDMEDVKSIFPCQVSGGDPVVLFNVSFIKDSNGDWKIYLCVSPADNPMANQQCAWLGYPSMTEFNVLKTRVANLEKKLGIS